MVPQRFEGRVGVDPHVVAVAGGDCLLDQVDGAVKISEPGGDAGALDVASAQDPIRNAGRPDRFADLIDPFLNLERCLPIAERCRADTELLDPTPSVRAASATPRTCASTRPASSAGRA